MTRLLSILTFVGSCAILTSQESDPFKPGKLPKDELATLVPGLTAKFISVGNSASPLDVRRVRLAALHVPAGAAPSLLLAPGPYVARLTGYVKAPIRSEYSFRILARGRAILAINDKEIVRAQDGVAESKEPIELARGYNKIEIQFDPPEKGDATFRVSWIGEGFDWEPVPPSSLFTRGTDPELVARTQVRDGRLFFGMHDCRHCHALPAKVAKSATALPELQHQAPTLEGAGSRFGTDWMAAWIRNPRDLRPKATMPTVLHGEVAPQQAADLAAYLAQQTTPEIPPLKSGEVAQGEKLFRNLGCVACHHFVDPKEKEDTDLYPLFYVGRKYRPDALHAFLREPTRHYPWVRMPDFKLTETEASHLTAFVLDQAKGTVPAAIPGDTERGRKLFTEAGCSSCHALKRGEPAVATKMLPFPAATSIEKGCLASTEAARGRAPDYGFKKNKLAALRGFLGKHGDSLKVDLPVEFAQRQVANLKCTACHRRDGGNSRWFEVMEEEGTLPENLPLLTWTGEKLRPEWTKKLLAGEHDNRARPWLKARMPAFPARADLLAVGLSHEHGFAPSEDHRPPHKAELVEVGKKLLPQMGGLNCIQCHGIGEQPAVAPFEAPGINLLDAAYRLRYDYYQRWMLDPPRVDLTTKMPKLAMDGETTGIRDVFEGDARRQFEALWHFIQTLPKK